MKQVLTFEQENKLISRAVGFDVTGLAPHEYGSAVKKALVKSLLKETGQRRELRRLNQSVRHINALEAQVAEGQREISTLIALLERDDEESEKADTDPAPPENNNQDEAYNAWDMQTRYPNLAPRKVG